MTPKFSAGDLCVHKGYICRIEKVDPHPEGLNPMLTLTALFTADGDSIKNAKIRTNVSAGSVESAGRTIDATKAEISRLTLFISLLQRGARIDSA